MVEKIVQNSKKMESRLIEIQLMQSLIVIFYKPFDIKYASGGQTWRQVQAGRHCLNNFGPSGVSELPLKVEWCYSSSFRQPTLLYYAIYTIYIIYWHNDWRIVLPSASAEMFECFELLCGIETFSLLQ